MLEIGELLFGPVVATILLGLTSFVLLYWFSTRNHDYWKNKGIRFSKPWPLVGSVYQTLSKPFHHAELERYKKHGRIYGHFEGNRPVISVADPELLRSIFVKDFLSFPNRRDVPGGDSVLNKMVSTLKGEDWKRVRTIITPTFTTGKIKRVTSIFKDCSRTLIENFKQAALQGKPVDAKRIYGAFTMDVIASSAFSTKIDSHNDPDNTFVKVARDAFTRNSSWRFTLLVLAPKICKLFNIGVFVPGALKFFKGVTLEIIKERKRTGQTRNDFLQLMLETANEVAEEQKWDSSAKDDIADHYDIDGLNNPMFKTVTSKKLSMDELVAQCVIFFVAGYDTTASTLSFASYELALNPSIQERARAEVDAVLEEANGEITYEVIQKMKYLDNVISETLRIYPPAVRLERVCESDYQLGDTGVTIPKGMIVSVPVHSMHHDPEFFPDPEKFEPDRFSPEERSKRHPYAYLPFGAGPRNCVGMRFALMEVKVCLAYVLRNFVLKRHAETQVPLQYYNGQQLLQPKKVVFGLELREHSSR